MLPLSEQDFDRIVAFMRETYGIDLSKKRALVQSRLGLDVARQGFSSLTQFVDAALSRPTGAEGCHLVDRLSTNHTFFFREPQCFSHMRDIAIPAFVARGLMRIPIWCAASSSGQECYSVAMMMEEALAAYPGVSYHILGSDVSNKMLEQARAGCYRQEELANIPLRFRQRYCRPLPEGGFTLEPTLKAHISWQRINLAQPLGALGHFALIFCRNVMIYFEPAVKESLTEGLYQHLLNSGFVYMGNTETLDLRRTRFRYLGPAVFEKLPPTVMKAGDSG